MPTQKERDRRDEIAELGKQILLTLVARESPIIVDGKLAVKTTEVAHTIAESFVELHRKFCADRDAAEARLSEQEKEQIRTGPFLRAVKMHSERTGAGLQESSNTCKTYRKSL